MLLSLLVVFPCFSLQPKVLPKFWNSTSPNQSCHPANWRGLADHPAPKVPLWTPEPKPSTSPKLLYPLKINLQQNPFFATLFSQNFSKKTKVRMIPFSSLLSPSYSLTLPPSLYCPYLLLNVQPLDPSSYQPYLISIPSWIDKRAIFKEWQLNNFYPTLWIQVTCQEFIILLNCLSPSIF